ncbi:unnamed protein product [Miscanthus lutarioriparius]|uniref:Uncharacterized protein n=1 Tax=Miscanthus lutarioriparius TaxID=422564 RepID=A0A811PQK5_9POAL|nr:unnamed protein product [Miscanthus lutarioriparius]
MGTPSAGGLGCFDRSSWLAQNINVGMFDYLYWLLAVLSTINLLVFVRDADHSCCSGSRRPAQLRRGTGGRDEQALWIQSLSEKMRPGESPEAAAACAVREELSMECRLS